MLDIELIRTNPSFVKAGIEKKNIDGSVVDEFLTVDEAWRTAVQKGDELRAQLNALSKERNIEEAKVVKIQIKEGEEQTKALEVRRDDLLNRMPNLPREGWPEGKDESDNTVLREVGDRPDFNFEPQDYLTLGKVLGIIDVERAARMSGSRFGYLVGGAALLEFALIQFATQFLVKKGFQPIVPPVMIRPEMYKKIGRLAAGQEEERFFLEKDNLFLVGSSEHTILPFYAGETLEADQVPSRFVGFSTCFRREAGSYGKDTKGILRVHQFDKVEMISFTKPEDTEKEHEFLLSLQEEMVQELGLPYRVVQVCTGDMGWTDRAQYDIEMWVPSEGKYRETHSCSDMGDFSSRGAQMKYKTADGKKEYLHTLNATGFAIGRTLIAIMENFQQKDGSIAVPKVLAKIAGIKKIVV